MLRVPARSAVAVAGLAIGVAALTTLLALTLAFRGAVVGSVLGDTVAINVRTVDYIAVAITVGLAAVGVADVLYLNVRERAAELALLRATGWSPAQLARLIAAEGSILGALGSVLGALVGLGLSALLTSTLSTHALAAALLSSLGGTGLSLVAGTVPARLAARRTVTSELAA